MSDDMVAYPDGYMSKDMVAYPGRLQSDDMAAQVVCLMTWFLIQDGCVSDDMVADPTWLYVWWHGCSFSMVVCLMAQLLIPTAICLMTWLLAQDGCSLMTWLLIQDGCMSDDMVAYPGWLYV